MHMIRVFNRLHGSLAAQYVVFPLSIRTPDDAKPRKPGCPPAVQFYEILPPKLSSEFRIGCPHPQDSPLFDAYVAAVTQAVKAVGDAGVIHGDLYLSNILWKQDAENDIEIKIIDWDTAHCISEGCFNPRVEQCLLSYLGQENLVFNRQYDELYLRVLQRVYIEDERDL
jgi:hypothetical protein